jgi:hypothetical protein
LGAQIEYIDQLELARTKLEEKLQEKDKEIADLRREKDAEITELKRELAAAGE